MPKLVTLATDGFTNFVTLPDGQHLNLGAVSPLTFIMTLVIGSKRKILDEFLKEGSSAFPVDLGAMHKLLAPVKKRWAATFPLIQSLKHLGSDLDSLRQWRKAMATDKDMKDAIAQMVGDIERQVALIAQSAKDSAGAPAATMKSDIEHLHDLVKELRNAPTGQSDNRAFYAADEALDANAKMAEAILDKVEQTHVAIERLATAGRRFNASAAKVDLHAIACDTQMLLVTADLANPAVMDDLQGLAHRSDQMHALFANAK